MYASHYPTHTPTATAVPWEHNPDDTIVAESDFKWLMAGEGHWVDTARLHQDSGYAQVCVQTALQSTCPALHQLAHWFEQPIAS
ncbi:MAG: hypothetical protein K9K38_20975 [Rhodoferax sp.]|nr:hypothetical protein [Rhodoferax sp.]